MRGDDQELARRELLQRAGLGAAALTLGSQLELAEALAETESSSRIGSSALRALKRSVRGQVLTRGDGGYNRARKVYNARFNGVRPAAVVRVRDAADVQAVMRWASRYDVNLRARSGGHSYAGYSTTAKGVVVDLSLLGGVRRSGNNTQATIGAGVELIEMYSKLAKHGVTVPGGSCPTVGISGLTLGGGMGFASRKLGLTCDSLTEISIVTPDGKLRKVSRKSNPDLFWACQGGGGGNFGIVTNFTFETHRVRDASYYFASWPWSQASEALAAWQRLVADAPSDLCPFFSFLKGSGEPQVHSEGQFFGSEAQLRKALKPLSDVAGVKLTVGRKSYGQLMLQWAGCDGKSVKSCAKPNRTAFYGASDYVQKPLDSKGREAMMRAAERSGSGAVLLDGYGGKIAKVGPSKTAFVHRDQLYCIQYYSESSQHWVNGARRKMRSHVSGQAYQNYIDPKLKGWKRAYYGKNLSRLVDVKTKYDPDNRLRFPQGLRPRS